MKKLISFIIILVVGIYVCFCSVAVSAKEIQKLEFNLEQYVDISTDLGLSFSKSLSENKKAKEIADNLGENKLFEYQIDESIIEKTYDAVEVAKMYYYKEDIFHMDTLSTYSKEIGEIKEEIIDFYNDKISYVENEKSVVVQGVNTDLFTYVTSGSRRVVSKPYGYMDHYYTVKKYRANNTSSLYIVETDSDFVPGIIAYNNGDNTYDSKMRLNFGYVHLVANQAIVEYDQSTKRYGGVPRLKDMWPINTPGTISITSSYSVGLNLGYSFKNGFSLDNISVEQQYDIGLNIGYSYSKTYTNQEPKLSTQRDSSNTNKYQWNFQYADGFNGNETFHLRTGYMFEMNNSDHQLIGEGQFGLEYAFRMKVQKWNKVLGIWFHDMQDPFDGYLYVNWW